MINITEEYNKCKALKSELADLPKTDGNVNDLFINRIRMTILERIIKKINNLSGEVLEALSDQEHKQWAKWINYMLFIKGTKNEDGSITIPADLVKRWERQMATDYNDLKEEEKQSDRNQALPVIEIIKDYLL